ncbi:MAG: J domain-containing protein [Synechococcaceae cyanobacterium SM2_3_2]|nr:J domain-containing protein [Synechococcaceae cyanobacterium SM2_3_2]
MESTGESYYQRLEIPIWASPPEIRRAYRRMSKRYHPDTSVLDPDVAVRRFQDIQEAYITLTNPVQKAQYDALLRAHYLGQRINGIPDASLRDPLGGGDVIKTRPLSGTELFALLLMGGTFAACLLLVGALAWVQQGLA